ncbi:MAG: TRAP transporter small permease [Lachnospiraceae bacterium]|jgi:TRAP-type C4-dicarboxylate transport system permease small subunit|nr:TRAP transporter small permease [Lachnospiraceae bacterium]
MKKLLTIINGFFHKIFQVLELYSQVVLLAIVLIVSAQVVARKFLGTSIIWSEEVARLLMVWMAFISLAIGVAKRLHISISMFYDRLPEPVQKAADVLERICTLFAGTVIMVYGARLVAASTTSTLATTKWPKFMLYLMIPVGGFFVIYCTILQIFFPDAARRFVDQEPDDAGKEEP